jgi:hypothetical protein
MLNWIKCVNELPPRFEEVLVWVDDKRGAGWSNNYPVVAYLSVDYNFWSNDRNSDEPLVGVVAWAKINKPEF